MKKEPKPPSVQVRMSAESWAAVVAQAERLGLTMVQMLDKIWRIAAPEIRKAKP